jgi:Ca2+-binding RTX toxin-like protein
MAAINGTPESDRLINIAESPVVGTGGLEPVADDTINGGAGDDIITTQFPDSYYIQRYQTANNLLGISIATIAVAYNNGNDQIAGGEGNDYINDLSGTNLISGDGGQDTLIGADSGQILGGDGDDLLIANFVRGVRFTGFTTYVDQIPYFTIANMLLDGGNGNDVFGLGFDFITSSGFLGGPKGEILGIADTGFTSAYQELNVTIEGGEGLDTFKQLDMKLSNTPIYLDINNLPTTLTTTLLSGKNSQLTLRNVEKADFLLAGSGNDYLTDSGNSASVLKGGGGEDFIFGGAGNNIIDGEDGDDRAFAGGGDDVILGGLGKDNLEGNTGNDTIQGGENNDGLAGQEGNDALYGNEGDDRLYGWTGDDLISGGDGNDLAYSDSGNDLIYGNYGRDWLKGGEGNDTVYGDEVENNLALFLNAGSAVNDTLYGEGGDDFIYGGYGDDSIFGGDNTDNLEGGLGNDTILGEEGDDGLAGQEGDDSLVGGNGNDRLYGWLGNDVLLGDAGSDTLYGDDGMDTLSGAIGNDLLNGGEGADIYRFGDILGFSFASLGIDQIVGFQTGVDKIQLQSEVFDAVASATVKFANVAEDSLAGGSQGVIVYSTSSGNLFYNSDGITAGMGTGGLFALLVGVPVITATDVIQ